MSIGRRHRLMVDLRSVVRTYGAGHGAVGHGRSGHHHQVGGGKLLEGGEGADPVLPGDLLETGAVAVEGADHLDPGQLAQNPDVVASEVAGADHRGAQRRGGK